MIGCSWCPSPTQSAVAGGARWAGGVALGGGVSLLGQAAFTQLFYRTAVGRGQHLDLRASVTSLIPSQFSDCLLLCLPF